MKDLLRLLAHLLTEIAKLLSTKMWPDMSSLNITELIPVMVAILTNLPQVSPGAVFGALICFGANPFF